MTATTVLFAGPLDGMEVTLPDPAPDEIEFHMNGDGAVVSPSSTVAYVVLYRLAHFDKDREGYKLASIEPPAEA